ncbi:hypothetical protein MNBD_GAMMA05-855 [hydrothermal vent metagenome]|uniref:L,D-TPase catalytic domain-containing protein n=1 Tax=hydrothermal vent metagenome TaxID=652676 RepID=A0A3B0W628_9ZZZZ
MIINRTNLFAVGICLSITLSSLGFSGQAMAYKRLNMPQQDIADYKNIDTASLSRLYPQTDDYIWIKEQSLSPQAYTALKFITNSSDHGLEPNDYHFDLLQQLDPTADDESHLFDFILSDGLLKLIRDISVGRLDPSTVDPKWSIPRVPFDAPVFLQQALATNYFSASLGSLIPSSNQYKQLTEATVFYQKIVDRGDWQVIPKSEKLRIGDKHTNISLIRNRLAIENNSNVKLDSRPESQPNSKQPNIYDDQLEKIVKQFQRNHSLYPDGIIGNATQQALNVSASERLQQININLERLRWLPNNLGRRYIMVNLANYRLKAIEDNQVKLNMRVIVGKSKRSTPSFSSQMTHVVLNPKWYIPNKLARLDLLPKQQNNPDYFDRFNIRVYSNESGEKVEISPNSVDWHSVSRQHFPYTLVQDPGKRNALGRLKFILPNPWRIYLHDTPLKSLFDRSKRTFSSGCIRVEDPFALAGFSLSESNSHQALLDQIENKESYSTKLHQPLSVYAIYSTVWLNGDELVFSPDNYKRDLKMAQYL